MGLCHLFRYSQGFCLLGSISVGLQLKVSLRPTEDCLQAPGGSILWQDEFDLGSFVGHNRDIALLRLKAGPRSLQRVFARR